MDHFQRPTFPCILIVSLPRPASIKILWNIFRQDHRGFELPNNLAKSSTMRGANEEVIRVWSQTESKGGLNSNFKLGLPQPGEESSDYAQFLPDLSLNLQCSESKDE